MKRTASATRLGDLKQGKGSLTTESGVLQDHARRQTRDGVSVRRLGRCARVERDGRARLTIK